MCAYIYLVLLQYAFLTIWFIAFNTQQIHIFTPTFLRALISRSLDIWCLFRLTVSQFVCCCFFFHLHLLLFLWNTRCFSTILFDFFLLHFHTAVASVAVFSFFVGLRASERAGARATLFSCLVFRRMLALIPFPFLFHHNFILLLFSIYAYISLFYYHAPKYNKLWLAFWLYSQSSFGACHCRRHCLKKKYRKNCKYVKKERSFFFFAYTTRSGYYFLLTRGGTFVHLQHIHHVPATVDFSPRF